MAHLFPLARNAADAVDAPELAARTRAGAEALVAGSARQIVRLETEWLTLEPDEAARILAAAEATEWGEMFIQRYEDASGKPVLAVTYWKLSDPAAAASAGPASPTPDTPAKAEETDDTDDLYFRKGRTKTRGARRKKIDPNQMDLFGNNEDPKDA